MPVSHDAVQRIGTPRQDGLTCIAGIGPETVRTLNEAGIRTYDNLGVCSASEIAKAVTRRLSAPLDGSKAGATGTHELTEGNRDATGTRRACGRKRAALRKLHGPRSAQRRWLDPRHQDRSEERRVGKERRSRWRRCHE